MADEHSVSTWYVGPKVSMVKGKNIVKGNFTVLFTLRFAVVLDADALHDGRHRKPKPRRYSMDGNLALHGTPNYLCCLDIH